MQKRNLRSILFACFSFLLLSHLLLFWHAKDDAIRGLADFSTFYSAARMVQIGLGHQLYDAATQKHVQSMLYPKATARNGLLPYIHPPFEALLYLPLARIPYPAAYSAWALVNLLLLFLTARLVSPYLPELKAVWSPLPVLIFLGYFPVFIAILQGQDSILLLFIFALVFVTLKQGHDRRGGFFLALGLFKFQFTLPFLVPFILWRRWKIVLGFLVSVATLFLLSLPVAGFHGTFAYVPFLFHLVQGQALGGPQHALGVLPGTMPNIRGAVDALGGRLPQDGYQKLAVVLLSSLAVLWAVVKWPLSRCMPERTFDLGFSLALAVSVLVSYHLQVHDMTLLLIPFVLALNHTLKDQSETAPMRFALYGLVALFFLSPLYLWLIQQGRLHLFFWPILFLGFVLSRQIASPGSRGNDLARRNGLDSAAHATRGQG